jgi:hypothetical protein
MWSKKKITQDPRQGVRHQGSREVVREVQLRPLQLQVLQRGEVVQRRISSMFLPAKRSGATCISSKRG